MDAKRNTFKAVKRLYRIRSKIVHTGSRDVTSDQVSEMRQLCLTALLALCASEGTAEFSSSDQLESWFEEKLLESRDQGDRST